VHFLLAAHALVACARLNERVLVDAAIAAVIAAVIAALEAAAGDA
jgi:hypothetical protein